MSCKTPQPVDILDRILTLPGSLAHARRLTSGRAMDVLRSIPELSRLRGPLFTAIGVFDGVHLGHQAVISTSAQHARDGRRNTGRRHLRSASGEGAAAGKGAASAHRHATQDRAHSRSRRRASARRPIRSRTSPPRRQKSSSGSWSTHAQAAARDLRRPRVVVRQKPRRQSRAAAEARRRASLQRRRHQTGRGERHRREQHRDSRGGRERAISRERPRCWGGTTRFSAR